jgi:hypothetical protein
LRGELLGLDNKYPSPARAVASLTIVLSRLGDDLLAGVAIDERVDIERYINTKALELELLQSGGLFKRAKAPATPENRWLSAILIQGDGIVVVTQRVRVEK